MNTFQMLTFIAMNLIAAIVSNRKQLVIGIFIYRDKNTTRKSRTICSISR